MAIREYALYRAEQIVEGKLPARDGVKLLFHLCMDCNYPADFMVWYNLDEGCDLIACGDEPWTFPGLTHDNIEQTIRKVAKDFIDSQRRNAHGPPLQL